MPFLCASFCQGLCFRRSEARVAVNQHVHTRVRVDIVVRDIEYGQNSMSEIKTLAQKMDIGRYGKLGNGIPKFSSPAAAGARQNRVFTTPGIFATHIGSATPCRRIFYNFHSGLRDCPRRKPKTEGRRRKTKSKTERPHSVRARVTHVGPP